MKSMRSKRWTLPLLCLLFGVAFLLAFWAAGNPVAGLGPFAVMIGYGVLLFTGSSEVVRVLRGQPSDEMWSSFNLRAIWFASEVLAVVIVGAFVYEIARGQDGQPYALLGFVFGVSYIASLLWFWWRS